MSAACRIAVHLSMGKTTAWILTELLGMSDDEVDTLTEDGVL